MDPLWPDLTGLLLCRIIMHICCFNCHHNVNFVSVEQTNCIPSYLNTHHSLGSFPSCSLCFSQHFFTAHANSRHMLTHAQSWRGGCSGVCLHPSSVYVLTLMLYLEKRSATCGWEATGSGCLPLGDKSGLLPVDREQLEC